MAEVDAHPWHSGVVNCAVYERGKRTSGPTVHYTEALDLARRCKDGFVWLGLHEPSAAEFEGLAAEFDLHPLAVEDAVKAHQRPKLERYGETLFIVLKTARYCEHEELAGGTEVVETGEVMLFVGPDFVVTVRHGDARRLDVVREGLEARPELLAHGPAAVIYAVADRVVDDYLAVAAALEDDVEDVELQAFTPGRTDPQRVYQLQREMLEFRRAVVPLVRPLEALVGGQLEQVPVEIREYLRDVEDHLKRVTEQVEGYELLLSGILQATLTTVSVQQNNDMRKISAWVAILAVPTSIAAIYGMNFDHMPELHWRYGYPLAVAVMAAICLALYRGFRRNGWL